MTAPEPIALTPLNNFRDLGGIAVEGGVLRADVIWRGDDPSTSPPEEVDGLVARGLTHVVDLRGDIEYGLTGQGHLADHSVTHVRLPFGTDPGRHRAILDEVVSGEPGFERRMGHFYAGIIADHVPTLVRIVETVADADGATLIHCTAGKDRTGMAIAGVLAVLGASDDAIAADYALTDPVMDRIIERIAYVVRAIAPDAPPPPPEKTGRDAFMTARPATMLAMLAMLRREHGGYAELLRAGGLSPDAERRIRERVVAPGVGE